MKKKTKQKNNVRIVTTDIPKDDLISVIILSDCPGYRMKSYGSMPLVNIDTKHLIDLQIEAIKKAYKFYEIILCVGFDADKIAKYVCNKYNKINIRIVENQLFNSSNSCEAIRLALNNTMNNKLLIIDGSLLFSHKTLKSLKLDSNATLTQKIPSENLQIGINVNDNDIAQHFSFGAYKTWSEILFLNDVESIHHLKKFLSHPDSKKKFIFEAINDLIRNDVYIRCIENKYSVHKLDNVKTYHYIKEHYEISNI